MLYDLGSGDGRIPVTAAKKFGVRAVGIDPGRDAVLASIFDGDLASAPQRLTAFIERVGVATDFSAYGVAEEDSRRMVANALEGVRGRNFIGASP